MKGFYSKTTAFLEVKPLRNLKMLFCPRAGSCLPNTVLFATKEGEMLLRGLNTVTSNKPPQWPSLTLYHLPATPLHFTSLNPVYPSCQVIPTSLLSPDIHSQTSDRSSFRGSLRQRKGEVAAPHPAAGCTRQCHRDTAVKASPRLKCIHTFRTSLTQDQLRILVLFK